jgi:hypothetical protein
MRIFSLCVILVATLMLASCFDPEPAEIGVNCKLNGEPKVCAMVLLNSKGVQIQLEQTDFGGIGYFKQVKPGTYTVKFQDKSGTFYPAEYTIEVNAGASEFLDVELSQVPAAPTETPAE